MNALKDSKGGPDGSPAKSIALDHLGGIAAKIRTVQSPGSHTVPTLDEIVSSVNVDGLTRLCQSQKLVDDFLLASAHQDDMYQVSHHSAITDADGSVHERSTALSGLKSFKLRRRSCNLSSTDTRKLTSGMKTS